MNTILPRLTRLAVQYKVAQDQLSDIQGVLEDLEALDLVLDEFETNFEQRYSSTRHTATVLPMDPEVRSQIEVYSKATQGLKKAKEAKTALQGLLDLHPDEKAAQRAIEEADRLINKYQRHIDAGRKIISTLSKKTMPATLKKLAAGALSKLQASLVNAGDLEVIPWQGEVPIYSGRQGAPSKVVSYSVVYKLPGVTLARSSDEFDRDQKAQTIRWEIVENHSQWPVSTLTAIDHRKSQITVTAADEAVTHFLKDLRGTTYMKGEGEATKRRLGAAQAIGSALLSIARKWATYGTEGPEIDPAGSSVHVGFRRYSKEYEDRIREEDRIEQDMVKLRKEIQNALQPYTASISKHYVGLGDKGWVEMQVTLK